MIPAGEKWDRRFAEQAWPTDPDPYLVDLAGDLAPGRGVDLGSGPGRNSLWLAANGWDMTLVDASTVGLHQATARAEAISVAVRTVHADVLAWQAGEAGYDLAVVANLHPGADELAAVLANAARALRPGGHLYVVGHHVANLGRHGPPDPDRLLTADRLHRALPADLAVQILDTRVRVTDQGPDGRLGDDGEAAHDSIVLAWATKTVTSAGGAG
jgi:SAM-dependent methyltransferase